MKQKKKDRVMAVKKRGLMLIGQIGAARALGMVLGSLATMDPGLAEALLGYTESLVEMSTLLTDAD